MTLTDQFISKLEQAGYRVAHDIPVREALAAHDDFWVGVVDGQEVYAALTREAKELMDLANAVQLTPEEELEVAEGPSACCH